MLTSRLILSSPYSSSSPPRLDARRATVNGFRAHQQNRPRSSGNKKCSPCNARSHRQTVSNPPHVRCRRPLAQPLTRKPVTLHSCTDGSCHWSSRVTHGCCARLEIFDSVTGQEEQLQLEQQQLQQHQWHRGAATEALRIAQSQPDPDSHLGRPPDLGPAPERRCSPPRSPFAHGLSKAHCGTAKYANLGQRKTRLRFSALDPDELVQRNAAGLKIHKEAPAA